MEETARWGGIVFGQQGQSYAAGARIYIHNDGSPVLTLQTSSGMPEVSVHASTSDIACDLAGNQGLLKTGPGALLLNVTPKSYTGTTHIAAGRLSNDGPLASQDFIIDAGAQWSFVATGGLGQIVNTISSEGLITVRGILTVDSSVDNTIDGVIQQSVSGALRKDGTGRLTLNSNNTYTGTTTVNGGILEISDGASIARGVTVNSGGTLQVDGEISQSGSYSSTINGTLTGSGVIGGATTFRTGSIHSPGNSPGIQTFENNVTYQTGSTVVWELFENGADPLDRGDSYDGIDVFGNLSITGATTIDLTFDALGSTVDWTNAIWDESILGTAGWKIFDVGGTTTGASNIVVPEPRSLTDSNGVTLFSARQGPGGPVPAYFFIKQIGNDLYLNYAVPEPGVAMLGGLGALALLRRRRD